VDGSQGFSARLQHSAGCSDFIIAIFWRPVHARRWAQVLPN